VIGAKSTLFDIEMRANALEFLPLSALIFYGGGCGSVCLAGIRTCTRRAAFSRVEGLLRLENVRSVLGTLQSQKQLHWEKGTLQPSTFPSLKPYCWVILS
jgi:hypothetical protein